MDKTLERLRHWNRRWNSLPRRAALLGGTLLAVGALGAALPYVWPFAAALLCSMLLEPLLLRLEKGVGRFRLRRKVSAPIAMLLLFGVAGAAVTALLRQLALQFTGLVKNVPQLIQWVDGVALPYLQRLYEDLNRLLPPSVSQGIAAALDALKQSLLRWAGSLSAAITGGAFSTALSLPNALLGVVLTVMGTYYFSADRERIRGFFRRALPLSWRQRYGFIRKNLLAALFGQIKSQLTVSLIVTAALTLAFVLYGVSYGLAAGVLIGKRLGRKEYDAAYGDAKKIMVTGLVGAAVVSSLLVGLAGQYVGMYRVDDEVRTLGRMLLVVFALYAPIKVENMILGGGILKSGGNTRLIMIIDIAGTWGIGIPLCFFAAYVLHWGIVGVYTLLTAEELFRLAVSLAVFTRKKWMVSLP